MWSLSGRPYKMCDGYTRRELLQIGGLGTLGLSLPSLLRAQQISRDEIPPEVLNDPTFGRAKNMIVCWMQGGPPQHETFDPKPHAPAEIRGLFKPIHTNVVGTQFCELLPRTSSIADKLAIVRSMTTGNDQHSASGYHVLTGYRYIGPNPRTITPHDWPWFGSLVKMLRPSEKLPPLSAVWIPDIMRLNESVTPAGQTAGFVGNLWNPDRFVGNPLDPNYHVEGLDSVGITPARLQSRIDLLSQFDDRFHLGERGQAPLTYDNFQEKAFDILTTGKVREAFQIQNESATMRETYGNTEWGQSCLLARRLIEAGARLVHVNWAREPGDSAVDNPMWDTHAQNADRLEDVLCPIFDNSFPTLIRDLEERGLLDETLVLAIAEFGRTPKINAAGGRDHWGHVFSFALAGAGIAGGQVYGTSDKDGAHPAENPVTPGDLTATIFHLLGIPHTGTFKDVERREHKLTEGSPLRDILGVDRAIPDLTVSEGDPQRIPPFHDALLLRRDFTGTNAFRPTNFGSRPKGWRAGPLIEEQPHDAFGVHLKTIDGVPHAAIGFGLNEGKTAYSFAKGTQAIIAQEMRNPRAGRFVFTVNAIGEGISQEFYEQVFLKHFTCRMTIFRFANIQKNPEERSEFASVTFQPPFAKDASIKPQTFEMSQVLDSPKPGSNFSIGTGLGIAVIVEKITDGVLELPAETAPHAAWIRIPETDLKFFSRTINDKVVV
ncbi:MAG: DUF1501 domain-containing protein [Planctomycetota bacterium]|nr:DUF1501 domain-containing protein [Planctomycetota bacterium]MDA1213721.1 DUF1501 domain-containing protein [Planctomycetota bacterium]